MAQVRPKLRFDRQLARPVPITVARDGALLRSIDTRRDMMVLLGNAAGPAPAAVVARAINPAVMMATAVSYSARCMPTPTERTFS